MPLLEVASAPGNCPARWHRSGPSSTYPRFWAIGDVRLLDWPLLEWHDFPQFPRCPVLPIDNDSKMCILNIQNLRQSGPGTPVAGRIGRTHGAASL